MIQRIQTIWLLLAAACAFLTYKFSFYSGNKIIDNLSQSQRSLLNASSDILITIITSLIGVGAFIAIFFFKNRKAQLAITIICLLLSIGNLILYFTRAKEFEAGTISLTSVFSFLIPIFLLLAARGIWKDNKLVKSLNRLR